MYFNTNAVLEQAKEHDSFYLYDEKVILERAERLKKAFEGIGLLYSIKTNPYVNVVKTVFSKGFGADAASFNEVLLAEKCGLKKDEIYYSAPGKTPFDIEGAVEKSIITADSLNEIDLIEKTAQSKGITAEIGVRINPDFSFYGGKGTASKFGIEEKQLFENAEKIKNMKHVKVIGIHVHLHSQELDARYIEKYYENMFDLAERAEEKMGVEFKFINLGSGIGIPYAEREKEVNVELLGEKLRVLVGRYKEKHSSTHIYVETGRYSVGKAGVYAAKVVDKKTSYGKTFVVLAATLTGFARPAYAHMFEKYAVDEFPAECEPFYTCKGAFQYIPLTENTDTEKVTLCGGLCTSTDIIEEDIELKKLDIGDVVVITNAGSYAAVITPMEFASLRKPAQLMLKADGTVTEA